VLPAAPAHTDEGAVIVCGGIELTDTAVLPFIICAQPVVVFDPTTVYVPAAVWFPKLMLLPVPATAELTGLPFNSN
jgi:hypothetical protein